MKSIRETLTKEEKKIFDHNRYLKAREYYSVYGKRHYRENIDIIRARNEKNRVAWRHKLIDFFGGKCVKCGYTDERALQVDHVNGGGRKDRDRKTTGFYKRVMEDKTHKYQLLCANCNWIKRMENHEHRI